MIKNFLKRGVNNFEAAALMWYVRNQFFFKQNLQQEKRVLLFKYEDIVTQPDVAFSKLYNFIETERPRESYKDKIYKKAVGRGSNLLLSEEITALCERLYQQLEEVYNKNRKSSIVE